MTDKLTQKQMDWAERYAYVMNKAGALNGSTGEHLNVTQGFWRDFKVQYHVYVKNVPEEIRNSFRWNKMIEDTYTVFSDLEKRALSQKT